MPSKRQKRVQESEKEGGRKAKIRRVIIDSDEEEGGEKGGSAPIPNIKNQKQTAPAKGRDVEDEVVSELDVYLLPVEGNPASDGSNGQKSIVNLNRLQFPQQHNQWLDKVFSGGDQSSSNDNNNSGCQAQYKAQVRHLRLRFGGQEGEEHLFFEKEENNRRKGAAVNSVFQKGTTGGIADLLRPPPSEAAARSSSSAPDIGGKSGEVFTGEGFSQHAVVSHAVGLFKEGKLFLLPIDKTYEMRRPLMGTTEKELVKAAAAQKDSSVASDQKATSGGSNLAPLRVRFARAENDFQRRRREQSAFYKQKLVDQDVWLPLSVERAKVSDLYKKEIEQSVSGSREEETAAEQEDDNNFVSSSELSLKDVLL